MKGHLNIKPQIRTIISNALSLSLLQWVNYLLPLFLVPYLVRSLGTDKFGLVMFAQSLATIFTIISDCGFSISGTRQLSIINGDKAKQSDLFWAITSIKGFSLMLSFTALILLIVFVPKLSEEPKLYLYSFGVTFGLSIFPSWFFQGIQKMKAITAVNTAAKVIFAILVVLFVTKPEDYLFVPIFNASGFIISGVLGMLYALSFVNVAWPKKNNIYIMAKESAPLFLSNIATSLYTSSNIIILGFLTNNSITGIYASFEKIILALKSLYTPIYQAIFPWLSQQKIIKPIVAKLSQYVFFIGLLGSITLVIFSDQILITAYNNPQIESFSFGFKLISSVMFLSGLNMLYNYLFLSSIKGYLVRLKVLGLAGLTGIILALGLTYFFGLYGTIISVVLTEAFLLILGYRIFRKIKV
jgi:PST family polysaccharide transporter